jgi:hypothetical protein
MMFSGGESFYNMSGASASGGFMVTPFHQIWCAFWLQLPAACNTATCTSQSAAGFLLPFKFHFQLTQWLVQAVLF